jgi:hypothetical protein
MSFFIIVMNKSFFFKFFYLLRVKDLRKINLAFLRSGDGVFVNRWRFSMEESFKSGESVEQDPYLTQNNHLI